jgi:uncharacterized protein (TIGR03437 family)
MRFVNLPVLAVCATALAPWASASVINFGPTNQSITLTGLGANASGQATARVTWGSCVFNNSVTTCTISAPFTGVGPGGTVSFVVSYQGNGPSPLNAVVLDPTNPNAFTLSVSGSNVSLVETLTETNGTVLTLYGFYIYLTAWTTQCSGVSLCDAEHAGLTPNATITGPFSATNDITPVIQPSGIISAGAFGAFPSVAPGTWIEIYGDKLSTTVARNNTWSASDFNGVNAPNTLVGTTVTIGGQPAFIDFVSQGQVNAQVPSNVATGQQQVVVTTAGGSSIPYPVVVNPIQPGLLAPPAFKLNGTQYVVALYPDGVTYVLPPGVTNAVATRRAKPGDTILFYGIGFGPVTPNIPAGQIVEQSNSLASSFKISFGGTPAQVTYFGLTPTFVGLYQFNVVVPNVASSDTVPLTFSVGTTAGTQTLVIPIGN